MILGIDTSCYTSSFAVVDDLRGKLIFEENRMLKVNEGSRGLRQSDGFFQHVNQLPLLFENMTAYCSPKALKAIAVSSKPRNLEASYMPVFHAGVLFCSSIGTALGIPVYHFSHQEGHIMAGLRTCGLDKTPSHFISMHLSGGTTELLSVKVENDNFGVTIIGRSLDISFGQLIDRIGVKLGMSFPAGPQMDALSKAATTEEYFEVPFKFHYDYNVSGLENKYTEMIGKKAPEYICKHLFNTIEHMLDKWIGVIDSTTPIILAGGVASNEQLQMTLRREGLYFAKPAYARDNAFGIALLGRDRYIKESACD